jgi:hypothetical protein
MPDRSASSDVIADLDAQLRSLWPGSRRLSEAELRARFPTRSSLQAAWSLPDAMTNGAEPLLASIDRDYPWTLPRISLAKPTYGISYPHVEADGQICVAPSSAVYELPVGISHVQALVSDAALVLEQGASGANDADFYAEAHSYWGLIEPALGSFLLLNEPPRVHSLQTSASCGADVVIGRSVKGIQDWSQRAQQRVSKCEPALLIVLNESLHPRDYPLTPRELIVFCKTVGAYDLLRQAVLKWTFHSSLRVLISFPYDANRIFLGAELQTPYSVRLPGALRNGTPGFRPAAKGASARLDAIARNPSRFKHWRAFPIHRDFLRERTAGMRAAPLRQCHVVVVGCGALGGQLAMQLAQAGVGRLTLIDDEFLDWRNVGRHVLDGTFIGRNKATALGDAILRRFPDAEVSVLASSWESGFAASPKTFDSPDLIVSAIGEPASNRHLDSLSSAGTIAPVVFGWMEAFAVSAHAVFRHPDGGGLCDLTDNAGLLLEPVVDLASAPDLPKEPACGAFYQPYSSLSALHCVSLVAEMVLDAITGRVARSTIRTWVGAASAFQDNHLSFTPVWHERLNKFGFSRLYEAPVIERH